MYCCDIITSTSEGDGDRCLREQGAKYDMYLSFILSTAINRPERHIRENEWVTSRTPYSIYPLVHDITYTVYAYTVYHIVISPFASHTTVLDIFIFFGL